MRVDDFDYELPPELIAQVPAEPRDSARLLQIGATLSEARVRDLPDLLRPGDLLVVNDTRVLPTRFRARRGAVPVEVTLIERARGDAWWALARPGKRLRPRDRVDLAAGLGAEVERKDEAGRTLLRFERSGDALDAAVQAAGLMPLPPYIAAAGRDDGADLDGYQTVFAANPGAVAAPTAGLHFTADLLTRLRERDIGTAALTLHVGAGTFAPVKALDTADHVMHSEAFSVPEATAARIASTRASGGRVVAVGTTVLRSLETVATDDGAVRARAGRTRLFITPGYRFRGGDLLLTNFHLPRSTLFMLVCAFAGTGRMRAAYAHAIRARYRFFSYGDACLLERGPEERAG